jgi:hypothetical protein
MTEGGSENLGRNGIPHTCTSHSSREAPSNQSSNPIRASRGSRRTAQEAERQPQPPRGAKRLLGTWPKRFIRFGDPEANGIRCNGRNAYGRLVAWAQMQEQWPEEAMEQHGGRGKDLGKRGPDQTCEVYEPRTA